MLDIVIKEKENKPICNSVKLDRLDTWILQSPSMHVTVTVQKIVGVVDLKPILIFCLVQLNNFM